MIVLHGMPRIGWGLVSPSPFCAKLELVLRMRGEVYETRPAILPRGAPRGKLPWIEEAGVRLADSSVIIRKLAERADVLEEGSMSTAERMRAQLIQRTVEESLYFALVAERWLDPEIRSRYTADLFAVLPVAARPAVSFLATRFIAHQLWQQGYGRRPLAEVRAMAADDLGALAWALGDAAYFAGDTPRAVDASVFGILANIWYVPIDLPMRRVLAQLPNLVAFTERIRARFLSEVPVVAPS